MAIQELSVHGYRSLRDVTWRPDRLNLLVGPNASGKSNVLRAIDLISVAARGDLEETITEANGVIPLLWDHRPGEFGWKVRIDPVDEGRDIEKDALTFLMTIAQLGTGSGYEIRNDSLGNWYKFQQGIENSPWWVFTRERGRAHFFDMDQSQLVRLDEEVSGTGSSGEGFDPSESLLSQISDFRNRIPALTRRVLEGWRVYHDVHAERGSAMRQPATTQVARRLHADGGNLTTVLHTLYTGYREFRGQVDEGMRSAFGNEYERLEFQPAAAQQIQLAVQWKSSSQAHAGSDLSDGTLRFLFLLTVLCNPDSTRVLAIDEPEVGLHPSMLPIVAEFAVEASLHTQIILTSHSPEFLDAFSDSSPSVTLCHWEEGETSLHPLDTEELAAWLARYRLGELFSRGQLESLAMPRVETSDDLEARLDRLPSEDDALASRKTP